MSSTNDLAQDELIEQKTSILAPNIQEEPINIVSNNTTFEKCIFDENSIEKQESIKNEKPRYQLEPDDEEEVFVTNKEAYEEDYDQHGDEVFEE